MEEEGAIQVLHAEEGQRREPILAAVGELQFDVVQARLLGEYGVDTRIDRLPFTCARWIENGNDAAKPIVLRGGALRCRDRRGNSVALFSSSWHLEYFQKENPDIALAEVGSPWTRND